MINREVKYVLVWALIYNHYKTKQLDAYYTKQFMDGMGVEVVEDITEAQVVI